VRKVRAIRRQPMQGRWDHEQVLRVTGVPDDPDRRFEDRDQPPRDAPPAEVIVIPHPRELPPASRLRREFRIELTDLHIHGYTAHCPKCEAIRAGRQVGTSHSPERRGKFRALLEMQEMVALSVQRLAGREMLSGSGRARGRSHGGGSGRSTYAGDANRMTSAAHTSC
jgi:hypothetical protein